MKPVPRGENPENYRGGARISVLLSREHSEIEILADDENIGTNGVMRFSPQQFIKTKTREHDSLIIKTAAGTAQIMGIRLGYDEL